jgi:hypothetical protein
VAQFEIKLASKKTMYATSPNAKNCRRSPERDLCRHYICKWRIGSEFITVAIEPAGEAQAQGAGLKLVGLAFSVEGDGRDEKTLGTGGHELPVEHEAEAATFLPTEDLETFGDALLSLGEELLTGELAWGVRIGVVFLGHGHDRFQVDVEPKFEHGFARVNHHNEQWRGGGMSRTTVGLSGFGGRDTFAGCHDGFKNVFFHRCDD